MTTGRTTRNQRSTASFACVCAPASRAGAGDLRVRLRVQATFACACGRAPASRTRSARAAFTHVQPSRTCSRHARARNAWVPPTFAWA